MLRRATTRGWLLTVFILAAAIGCNRTESTPGGPTASLPANSSSDGGETSDGVSTTPLKETTHPVVRIETTLGNVTVELDGERAPITVKNFLWYVNNGQYRDTIFHQIIPGYVAIGGGYTAELKEKPTLFAIRNESDGRLRNVRGTLAMARRPDAIDSSTCQFFFNLADNPNLDQKNRDKPAEFGYCVFGRVIEGLEVLDRISSVPVADKPKFVSMPVSPVVIKSIARLR